MIKFLALLHRYGWIAIMLLFMNFFNPILVGGVFCFCFSLWSLIGYALKWKHIYCSYQNAYHKEMTPNIIVWSKIKKFDAIGIPMLFMTVSIVLLILYISN